MSDQPELEFASGERIPITGPITIGRGTDADIVLTDAEASRQHARLELRDGLFLLTDLESRNGTAVNGNRVSGAQALRNGDIVRIGQTQIIFHAPEAPPPPAGAPESTADPAATVVAPRLEPAADQAGLASSPLQVLGRITRGIAGRDDAREIADMVTSAIRTEYGCAGASLVLVDPASGELYFASVASDSPSLKLITLAPGQGIAGRAIELKQPALVADVARDPGHAAHVDRALGFTSRSIIAAPVVGEDGAVLGALEAINPTRKPEFDADDLEFLVLAATALGPALSRATHWEAVERERAALARVGGIRKHFVATSPTMIRLVMEAAALHEARTPVYLAGETGTGRTTLARLIHEAAGLPGGLDEISPGGDYGKAGRGTLFVPAVDALPPEEQDRLAAALAGTEGKRPAIVTGSASLLALLSSGKLSPALHERLEAGQIVVPPLRSRLDELEPLIEHFAGEVSARLGREPIVLREEAIDRLRAHGWPGNVGELRTVVTRLGILARDSSVSLEVVLSLTPELAAPADAPAARPRPLERRRAEHLARARSLASTDDESDRVSGAQALALNDSDEATGILLPLLADESAPVRAAAAGALAGRHDAAASLAGRLEYEVDLGVALTLLESLAATGQAGSHPVVARALRAGDPRMRRLAMHALRGTPLAREAAESVRDDPEPSVQVEALAALVELGEPLEEALVALASEGEAPVRAAACEALGELGLASDRLLELTANGDRAVRVAAIRALGHHDSAAVRSALLELLSDVTVSAEAATALGRLRAEEAVPRLAALLDAPEAPLATRRSVVQALARIPGSASAEALTSALGDDSLLETALEASAGSDTVPLGPEVLRARVEQLLRAGVGTPQAALHALEAFSALARRVGDSGVMAQAVAPWLEDPEVRTLAVEFLEELDDPAVLPLLAAHAVDSPEAQAVIEAHGDAGIPGLVAALEAGQPEAAERLAAFGPGVVPALLPLLADPALARAASRAILEVGDAALPALVTRMESAGPEELPALLQTFGQVAPGRLANYVATFLDRPEPPVRYAAMVALGNLPDPRSESELLARLDSADPVEAPLATLALGRIQSADAFEVLSRRVGHGDRRSQYALAGAVNEYNLRQAPVVEMVRDMVRGGLPFSSGALEAALTAGALSPDDFVATLHATDVPETQKLRLLAATGRLNSGLAVPPLLAVLRSDPAEPLLSAAARALAAHESAAREEIAELVLASETRTAGLRVLALVQEPRALLAILRRLAPALETDTELRAALREMGDLLLGPLIDVIHESWDLESLGLLWQLTGMVEPGTP